MVFLEGGSQINKMRAKKNKVDGNIEISKGEKFKQLVENLRVIYEDNHLLVVEKFVNVLSQADDTKDVDMLSICKEYVRQKYNKPGQVFMGLVHRLDRPVGGVMVFAKTSKAASRLSDQVRTRIFKKEYLAIVSGFLEDGETLTDYLYKDKKKNIVYVVDKNKKDSKYAQLSYNLLGVNKFDGGRFSLVRIFLKTGRSHQIRVQFASRNHPLYGDQKYSSSSKVGEQIALWANSVEFIHPTKKEVVRFYSNPPKTLPWKNFNL